MFLTFCSSFSSLLIFFILFLVFLLFLKKFILHALYIVFFTCEVFVANKLHRIDHHCSCLRQVPAILSSWLYRWVVYQMYGSCGVLRAWPAYWHIGDVLSPHCQRCAEYRYRNHRRGVISNTVADKPARLDRYVYLFKKFTVVKKMIRRMQDEWQPRYINCVGDEFRRLVRQSAHGRRSK